ELFRERCGGRHGEEGEESVKRVGSLWHEVAIPAKHIFSLVHMPEHRPGVDGADWVKPEEERGDDTEISTAATDRPEEIGVSISTCGHEPPIRQDDIGLQHVIDAETEAPPHMSDATTKRDTADTGGRDDAARCRQSKGVGRVVDIAEQATRLNAGGTLHRIDPDPLHR